MNPGSNHVPVNGRGPRVGGASCSRGHGFVALGDHAPLLGRHRRKQGGGGDVALQGDDSAVPYLPDVDLTDAEGMAPGRTLKERAGTTPCPSAP